MASFRETRPYFLGPVHSTRGSQASPEPSLLSQTCLCSAKSAHQRCTSVACNLTEGTQHCAETTSQAQHRAPVQGMREHPMSSAVAAPRPAPRAGLSARQLSYPNGSPQHLIPVLTPQVSHARSCAAFHQHWCLWWLQPEAPVPPGAPGTQCSHEAQGVRHQRVSGSQWVQHLSCAPVTAPVAQDTSATLQPPPGLTPIRN